jgi:hypothetical protein
MTEKYCQHSGKFIHASAADCLQALKRLCRAGGPMGNPYRCNHCGGWHQTKGQAKTKKHLAFKRRKRGE